MNSVSTHRIFAQRLPEVTLVVTCRSCCECHHAYLLSWFADRAL